MPRPSCLGYAPNFIDKGRRDALLLGSRRNPWVRALEERWNGRRNLDGERHLPGVSRLLPVLAHRGGSILFFDAYEPKHGDELWKSDGTRAGTVMVKDIRPGTGDSLMGIRPPWEAPCCSRPMMDPRERALEE